MSRRNSKRPHQGKLESTISRDFATSHAIDPERIESLEATAIVDVEKVWGLLDGLAAAESERLIQEPAWGCIRTMLNKTRGHVLSSLMLYVSGERPSAEVVARTAIEASVNILYILQQDRDERLGRYLSTYIVDQRSKVEMWERSLPRCPEHERDAYRAGIAQKREALSGYETVICSAFSGTSVRFDPSAKLPSVFYRFREVGKEASYRTVYMALCSQTHDGAEDLLNQFSIRICSPHLISLLELETKSFSRMMAHVAAGYFLEACKCYAEAFSFQPAIPVATQGIDDAYRRSQEAALEFHKTQAEMAGENGD